MICECAISLSLLSYHLDRSQDWNEINPGVIVEKNNGIAGVYRNSYSRTTAFVGGVLPVYERSGVAVGIVLAVGTGYRVPVFGALRAKVGQHEFTFVPPTKVNSAVVAYSIRVH